MSTRPKRYALLLAAALLAACGSETHVDPVVSAGIETNVPLESLDCPTTEQLQSAVRDLRLPTGFETTKRDAADRLYPVAPIREILTCSVTADSEDQVERLTLSEDDAADSNRSAWRDLTRAFADGMPARQLSHTGSLQHWSDYYLSPIVVTSYDYADGSRLSVLSWYPGAGEDPSEFDPRSPTRHETNGDVYCFRDDGNPPLGRTCSTDQDALAKEDRSADAAAP